MTLIDNKYLATNLNRMKSGPGTLLKADNVRIDGGRLRSRMGQDLMIPEDPFGLGAISGDPAICELYRCRKLFYYNGNVWGYFQASGQQDAIGYFDRSVGVNGRWVVSLLPEQGVNIDNSIIPPQIQESNNRLMLATSYGVYCSPKLDNDQLQGLQSIQTTLRTAGCPPALPIHGLAITDTTGTYNSNWLEPNAQVAYRHVWKYTDANGAVSYGAVSDSRRATNTAASNRATAMTFFIPLQVINATEISRFSCQVYRTYQVIPSINNNSISAGDQMFLVTQLKPTFSDTTVGQMYFVDILQPAALQGPLYTNQTQQGAASSRIRPPTCRTMADFAGAAWFGNTTDRWLLPFQLNSVRDSASATARGLADSDIIIIGDKCFQAKTTQTIDQNQFTLDNTSGYTNAFARIRNTVYSLASTFNVDQQRDYYNLQTLSGPDDICGQMAVEQLSNGTVPSSVTPYIGLYRSAGWPTNVADNPSPITPTPLVTQEKGKGFKITRIRSTVLGDQIIFTLDAPPDFVVGDTINLASPVILYKSSLADKGIIAGPTTLYTPGQYKVIYVSGSQVKLETVVSTFSPFDAQIGVNAGNYQFATVWSNLGAMHCVIDSVTLLKTAAVGQRKTTKNRVMYSPFYEPESAPALNYFDVGGSDHKIIRLIKLNKSLFVFKQDGLFRISGNYPDFTLQQFDPNIILLGPDLVCTMAGACYALTTNGIYMISQNSAQRISYDIQNLIQNITWRNPSQVQKLGFSVGHEADHSVTFWLPRQVSEGVFSCDIAFTYDGDGWTVRTDQANGACCGIKYENGVKGNYLLYTMKQMGSGWLTQQRKAMDGTDYCDESIPIVVTPDSSIQAFISTTNDAGLLAEDALLPGSVVVVGGDYAKRAFIVEAHETTPGVFNVVLQFNDPQYSTVDWSGADGTLYISIPMQWQYGIQGAEQIESRKHFSQLGLVFQQPYFSVADVGFASDVVPNQSWLESNLKGFTLLMADPTTWPLMQQDFILSDKTLKALVSSYYSRCSQLRVSIKHSRAMQFISVYGYFVRYDLGGKNIERNNGT